MSPEALKLLGQLKDANDRGVFATACDGPDRKLAHELQKAGLVEWHGISFGSQFWSITHAGVIHWLSTIQ